MCPLLQTPMGSDWFDRHRWWKLSQAILEKPGENTYVIGFTLHIRCRERYNIFHLWKSKIASKVPLKRDTGGYWLVPRRVYILYIVFAGFWGFYFGPDLSILKKHHGTTISWYIQSKHMTILTDVLSWDPATIVTDLPEFTTVDEHTRLNVRLIVSRWFGITKHMSLASEHLQICLPVFMSLVNAFGVLDGLTSPVRLIFNSCLTVWLSTILKQCMGTYVWNWGGLYILVVEWWVFWWLTSWLVANHSTSLSVSPCLFI